VNPFVRVLILLALSLWPAQAMGQTGAEGAQRTERIEAELVPMSAWAAPGSTAVVAVKQTIRPDWHTYWRNPGDSGGATTLAWTLPRGVSAGDIVWPVPERQRISGLMNYGYSGEVLLPVTVRVPASARPGSQVTLSAKAAFLVCSDVCIPEDADLSITLDVVSGPTPGVFQPLWLPALGISTVSGSAPLATPYSAVPGFIIAAVEIEPAV
jgi:thiol:disulfide interchange protein DsbD